MNKIVKLSVVLFLVCAVFAGILGVTNMITAPFIQAQADAKTAAAYAAVLQAEGYDDLVFEPGTYKNIDKIAQARGGEGWVVTTTFSGAQGMITMIVGVSPEYTCTGISITDHSETSGLGANAASSAQVGIDFRAQFVGKDENVKLADIDALAGATITSRAVTNAVSNAIKCVKSAASGGPVASDDGAPAFNYEAEVISNVKAADGSAEVVTIGYGMHGEIKVLVKVSAEGTVAEVKVLEHAEVLGKDLCVDGCDFLAAFVGGDENVSVDAVSGVTLTSDALNQAVGAAVYAAKYMDELQASAETEPEATEEPEPAEEPVAGAAAEGVGVGSGMWGDITVTVKLAADGTIAEVKVTEHSEVLGADYCVDGCDFLNSFVGLSDPSSVDAIAGVTMTADGIKTAVAEAIAAASAAAPAEEAEETVEAEEVAEAEETAEAEGVSENGMWGDIKVLVKVTAGVIDEVKVLEHREILGGYLCAEGSDFLQSFIGMKDPAEVDAVAGVTVTCDAIKEAAVAAMASIPAATAGGAAELEGVGMGMWGEIKVLVKLAADGTIEEVTVTDHGEMLGASLCEDGSDFLQSFVGMSNPDAVDAVAGVSMTAEGIKEAVAAALSAA